MKPANIAAAMRQFCSGVPPLVAAFALAAVAIRLWFWFYTNRTWEDALITVLHGENLLDGFGLTHYKPDEPPVHGFTSPLSVLVPLFGELLYRGSGLYFLKFISALSGGLSVIFAWKLVQSYKELALSAGAFAVAATLLAVEHHQILWGMSGMETQMAVMFLLASMWSLRGATPTTQGVLMALCAYVRPDFAIWIAIGLLARYIETHRQNGFRDVLRSALVAAVLYAPWLIFTQIYYGSPIPNTIPAKSNFYDIWWKFTGLGIEAIASNTYGILTRGIYVLQGPAFGGNGTGFRFLFDSGWISKFMMAAIGIAVFTIVRRRHWTLAPLIAFLAVFSLYYIFVVPILFGWYTVPVNAVAVLLAARGIDDLARWIARASAARASAVVAAAYFVAMSASLFTTFPGERNVQMIVEDGIRRKVGEYLNSEMTPQQRAVCEPLGYTSYYSRRAIYDVPGLCSRRVMEFFRDHQDKRGFLGIIEHLKPDYLILRPGEYLHIARFPERTLVDDHYQVVKEFYATPEQAEIIARRGFNQDLHFRIYKRVR